MLLAKEKSIPIDQGIVKKKINI